MVSTYTVNKRIEQPGFNDYVDTWDVPVNNDWAIIDLALGGSVSINTTGLSGNVTLATAQYQPLKIVLTGTPTAAINYRVPSGVGGLWVVRNNTSGGFAVTVDSLAGGSAVTIPAATNTLVTCDGTATGMFLAINTAPAAAGSTTQLQYNLAGVLAGSANFTFDGTTATIAGLNVTGSTVLGDAAGDTMTLNGTAIAIPNTVNLGSNTLFLQPTGTKAGIGTATLGAEMLTVAGVVYSTAGGFKFPDGTTQTSASAAVAGSDTQVQYNDGGSFGAEAAFTYNKTTDTLTVPNLTVGTALTASGTLSVAGQLTASGGLTAGPTGSISIWPSSSIPSRALLCDGTSYAVASYAGIFAVVGYTYGGAGANFNVPDLRGRVVAGVDGGAGRLGSGATGGVTGAATLAATGGEQSHAQTATELAAHTHAVPGNVQAGNDITGGGSVVYAAGLANNANSGSAGSGTAANVVQPTMVMNFIIWM